MAGCRSGSGQLRAEVRGLLAQAEAADAAADAHYGVDRRGNELPAELQRRETRLKKIRAAPPALRASMEPRSNHWARAQVRAEIQAASSGAMPASELQWGRAQVRAEMLPEPSREISFI